MTKNEKARAYRDWKEVYYEEVVDKIKHWGSKRSQGSTGWTKYTGSLEPTLFGLEGE